MNFSFADFGVLSRTMLGLTALAMAACTSSPYVSDSKVFDASPSVKRARFPKVQKIGVVELSGARITSRAYQGSADQLEYIASGGALLEKRMDSPIWAQAEEILVTPDAAILKGRQAMVKKAGQLYKAEAESTEFVIDGTQVKVEGPHSIQDLGSEETKMVGVAAPLPAPSVPEKPAKTEVKKAPPSKPIAEKPTVKPAPAPVVATKPKETKPGPQTKPEQKPTLSATPKPKPPAASAPKPTTPTKPAAKPEPKVNRQELLNLMREPSE